MKELREKLESAQSGLKTRDKKIGELQQKCKQYQEAAKKKKQNAVPAQTKARTEAVRQKPEQKKKEDKDSEAPTPTEDTKQPTAWEPQRYDVCILTQEIVYAALTDEIDQYSLWLRQHAEMMRPRRLEVVAEFKRALKEVSPMYEVCWAIVDSLSRRKSMGPMPLSSSFPPPTSTSSSSPSQAPMRCQRTRARCLTSSTEC